MADIVIPAEHDLNDYDVNQMEQLSRAAVGEPLRQLTISMPYFIGGLLIILALTVGIVLVAVFVKNIFKSM